LNIKWKIVEQDFANFELSNTQLRLVAGDVGDNYLCGKCGYLLAEKIPKDIKKLVGIHTVRCPNCKKVNKVEWYSTVS
jgi:Zn ribbon nucleic-acid-binding protein